MILAIFALSLELLVGTTGLVCFGHAAFFGIGAYAAVLLSPQGEAASLLWLLPAAMAAAARAMRWSIGALSLRTRGVYFIMVTLAFAQMAYYVFHDTPLGGGTDGIYMYVEAGVVGGSRSTWTSRWRIYYFVLGCAGRSSSASSRCCCARAFGRALAGIRVNEQRMRATGFSDLPLQARRLRASPARSPAWPASCSRCKDGFVNPELLALAPVGAVLMMVILGGLGHLRGA